MTKERPFQLITAGGCLLFCLAMISPTLELSREKIQRAKCASNLKQLGMAWEMYLNEYHAYVPPFGGVIDFLWGRGRSWMDRIFPYVSPEAVGKGPRYPASANHESTEVFRCPSIVYAPDGRKYLCGYVLNSRLYIDSTGYRATLAGATNRGKLAILYDRNRWTRDPSDADMTDEWGNTKREFSDAYGPGGLWHYPYGGPDFSGPHDGGYDILFADWHVKWFEAWDSEKMTRHPEF